MACSYVLCRKAINFRGTVLHRNSRHSMIFNLSTYFIAAEPVLDQAYFTYRQRAREASLLPGVEVLYICTEPVRAESEDMKEDLVAQFRIERPDENWEDLHLYLCTSVVSVGASFEEERGSLASLFLMDEEYAVTDKFPSSVGLASLAPWRFTS